jgi:hypothetical protein
MSKRLEPRSLRNVRHIFKIDRSPRRDVPSIDALFCCKTQRNIGFQPIFIYQRESSKGLVPLLFGRQSRSDYDKKEFWTMRKDTRTEHVKAIKLSGSINRGYPVKGVSEKKVTFREIAEKMEEEEKDGHKSQSKTKEPMNRKEENG